MSEIPWESIFYHGAVTNERDIEPLFTGIDGLVKQYQAPYDDPAARAWIERRLRKWWQGQQREE